MARIKGTYVTNLEGRVGNVVYRNRKGKNIASERPASVSNPNTVGQAYQRLIFTTVTKAQSALHDIVNHSFSNCYGSGENLNMFTSINLKELRGAGSLEASYYMGRGGRGLSEYPFMASYGTLPSVDCSVLENAVSINLPSEETGYVITALIGYNTGTFTNDEGQVVPSGFVGDIVQFEDKNGNATEDGKEITLIRTSPVVDGVIMVQQGNYRLVQIALKDSYVSKQLKNGYCGAVWYSLKSDNGWDYSCSKLAWYFAEESLYAFTLEKGLASYGAKESPILDSPDIYIDGEGYIWTGSSLVKETETVI